MNQGLNKPVGVLKETGCQSLKCFQEMHFLHLSDFAWRGSFKEI